MLVYLYFIFFVFFFQFFHSLSFSFVVSVGRDVLVLVNLRSKLGKVTESCYPIKTEQKH